MYHKIQSYQCLVWLVLGKRADTAVRQSNSTGSFQLTVETRSLQNVFATKMSFQLLKQRASESPRQVGVRHFGCLQTLMEDGQLGA